MHKFYPPIFNEKSFHCPLCNVYAKQDWHILYYHPNWNASLHGFNTYRCSYCNGYSVWKDGKLLYPESTIAPNPHEDLPQELLEDYIEASNIVNKSPRGAAALLRLVLQKLMVYLGEQGKDINKDIGSLVQKGLHPQVQQALDIVRVIGNESVHPGQLDLKDDTATTQKLFEFINFIVEDRITRLNTIQSLFDKLPEGKRKGIENRDKTTTP
ncbi:DUF4145 domain-containing protein [Lysinibacillus sp. M3]|uniref:DUF4145 domain-containing protein n=1 Tax=Lysinibacillus zambalensis TaxID=3160866 RepID=A0ABV1MV80_9BACI